MIFANLDLIFDNLISEHLATPGEAEQSRSRSNYVSKSGGRAALPTCHFWSVPLPFSFPDD